MDFEIKSVMAAASGSSSNPTAKARQNGQYVVQSGDTWISLAKKFGVSNADKPEVWQEFRTLCGGGELKVGQKIKVPSAQISFKSYSSSLFRSEKRAKRKTAEAAQEALRKMAKDCGMSFKDFCKLNGISENYIPSENEKFYVKPKLKAAAANKKSASTTSTTSSTSSSSVPSDKRVAKYKKGSQTIDQLRKGAISAGETEAKSKFRAFCSQNGIKYDEKLLDLTPISRYPKPTIDANGNITTTKSELLAPTKGNNGRVVVINAGHGGYSNNSGYFDAGAYSFVKKGNGKYAPLLEYEVTQRYANDLADKLRAQGYYVIITSGHVDTFSSEKSFKNIVNQLQNGTFGSSKKKFSASNISFISLHADSGDGKKYSAVCYDPQHDAKDGTFAETMNTSLNADDWISSEQQLRIAGTNGLDVLNQTVGVPSALLEIEYVNGSRAGNLDSKDYQNRFIQRILNAYSSYYGDKK